MACGNSVQSRMASIVPAATIPAANLLAGSGSATPTAAPPTPAAPSCRRKPKGGGRHRGPRGRFAGIVPAQHGAHSPGESPTSESSQDGAARTPAAPDPHLMTRSSGNDAGGACPMTHGDRAAAPAMSHRADGNVCDPHAVERMGCGPGAPVRGAGDAAGADGSAPQVSGGSMRLAPVHCLLVKSLESMCFLRRVRCQCTALETDAGA